MKSLDKIKKLFSTKIRFTKKAGTEKNLDKIRFMLGDLTDWQNEKMQFYLLGGKFFCEFRLSREALEKELEQFKTYSDSKKASFDFNGKRQTLDLIWSDAISELNETGEISKHSRSNEIEEYEEYEKILTGSKESPSYLVAP